MLDIYIYNPKLFSFVIGVQVKYLYLRMITSPYQ